MEKGKSTSQILFNRPDLVFGLTDKHLEQRINPTISPEDDEWTEVYNEFKELLGPKSKQSLGQILANHFTEHEARLFTYADCSEMKSIQDENTIRYQHLLKSRFHGVETTMAAKLAMMYFGLPVEPVDIDLRGLRQELERRGPEAPRFDVKPPLHFLTAHKDRTYGNDYLRGREEEVGPLPVEMPREPILGLRGGEEDSSDESLFDIDAADGLVDPEAWDYYIEEFDFVPRNESPLDLGGDDWVNLYGFQGVVPFIPENWTTYGNAVRRLLSVPTNGYTTFALYHYKRKDGSFIDEIYDSLPLTPDSSSMEYVSKLFKSKWRYHYEKSVFFVKLQTERAPKHWEPEDDQLGLDVIKIRCPLPETPSWNRAPPISYAYVSFPRLDQPRPPPGQIQTWGANQYSLYIRTALEVLIGRKSHSKYHHGFHRFCDNDTDPESVPSMYGLANISSFDLVAMLLNDQKGTLQLKKGSLERKEVAFVLPGYYPIGGDANMPTVKRVGPKKNRRFPNATQVIRDMVRRLLGKHADGLCYVRILAGTFVLGPNFQADQPHYTITMTDKIPKKSEDSLDTVLNQFVKAEEPIVVLYPEWRDDEIFMYGGWTKEAPEKAAQVPMPPLSSKVQDFRGSVADLLKLTGGEPHQVSTITKGRGYISIQPVLGPKGETSTSDQVMDFPCFFVGPHTTDNEWFAIRAQIPTRGAVVNVLGEGDWDWMAQVTKNSIWGPRYSYLDEANANRAKLMKRPSKPEKPLKTESLQNLYDVGNAVMKYSPNVPVDETKPERDTSGHNVDRSIPPHPPNATHNLSRGFNPKDPPPDPDDRRRAWATQPSIFDGYNLRTWPANSGIRIPSAGPPKEHILRVADSVPMVSKAILTPTEQAQLQKSFFNMRNIALNRVSKCSYADCHFTYKQRDVDALAEHMTSMHLARKCLWCDEPLYEHWSDAQRVAHLRMKHKDQLMEALGVTRGLLIDHSGNGTVSIPLKRVSRHHVNEGLAMVPSVNSITTLGTSSLRHVSSEMQSYCDRCGRRRASFFNDAERDYHDRNCRPGIYNNARCEFCRACGGHYWLSMADAAMSNMANGMQASCNHSRDNPAGHHCQQCGFNLHGLPPEGVQLHKVNCKGYESTPGKFCCYCGLDLSASGKAVDFQQNLEHMRQCFAQLVAGAQFANHVDMNSLGSRLNVTRLGPPAPRARRQSQDQQLVRQATPPPVVESIPSPVSSKVPAAKKGKEVEKRGRPRVKEMISGVFDPAAGVKFQNDPKQATSAGPSGSKAPEPPKKVAPVVVAASPSPVPSIEPVDEDSQPKSPSSKRRKNRKRKRNSDHTSDGDYEVGDDEEDDDTDMESEAEHPDHPRRSKSPDWVKKLGLEDPHFEPKGDYYCSKCLRKAPNKAHKRERSPLGLKKEIEMHVDKTRCCKIRNGIGSAENLPNHSGWIPASEMPKPLSAFRKKFLQKYPAYSRTLYPLHDANRNGSYWRSDPNNDENDKWWGIPWPPYELNPPFPGWEGEDDPEDPQSTKKKQDFILKAVHDPTYRYQSDEDVDEDLVGLIPDNTEPSDKKKRRTTRRPTKRPTKRPTANPLPLADRITKPSAAPSAGGNAAGQNAGNNGITKKTKRMGKSMAKRQKTKP